MKRWREKLALWIAPSLRDEWWVGDQYDEAFARLAAEAYGRRDAPWSSPVVLVDMALRQVWTRAVQRRSR